MITRDEYLNALEVIDQYHQQFREQEDADICKKTLITEWLDNLPEYPGKTLYDKIQCITSKPNGRGGYVEYIEDINMHNFMRTMGLGKGAWNKFLELRQKYPPDSLK